MGSLRLILGLAVAIIVVSFGVKNMQSVRVEYFQFGAYSLPLFYLLVGVFAAGFLLAWLSGVLDRIRHYQQVRSFRRQVRKLETEIEQVRTNSRRLLVSGAPEASEGDDRRAAPAALPAAPPAAASAAADVPAPASSQGTEGNDADR